MSPRRNDWARVVAMVLVTTLLILEPDYVHGSNSNSSMMSISVNDSSNISTSPANPSMFTAIVATNNMPNITTGTAMTPTTTSSSVSSNTPYVHETTPPPTEPHTKTSTGIMKTYTATTEPSTDTTDSSSLDDETLATIIGIVGGLVIVGLLVLIFFLSIILVKSYKEMVQSQKNRLLAREEEAINEAFKAATCNNHSTDPHEELLNEHRL